VNKWCGSRASVVKVRLSPTVLATGNVLESSPHGVWQCQLPRLIRGDQARATACLPYGSLAFDGGAQETEALPSEMHAPPQGSVP
jgi:hypothetical protein